MAHLPRCRIGFRYASPVLSQRERIVCPSSHPPFSGESNGAPQGDGRGKAERECCGSGRPRCDRVWSRPVLQHRLSSAVDGFGEHRGQTPRRVEVEDAQVCDKFSVVIPYRVEDDLVCIEIIAAGLLVVPTRELFEPKFP